MVGGWEHGTGCGEHGFPGTQEYTVKELRDLPRHVYDLSAAGDGDVGRVSGRSVTRLEGGSRMYIVDFVRHREHVRSVFESCLSNFAANALFLPPPSNLIGQLKLPLVTASAMLRLGSKYQIAFLRQDAIRRLERSFPSSLALFSNRFTINRPRSGRLDAYEVKDVDIPGDASCIAVVRLARTYNLPHLLPPALFMCAQLEPSKLVGGWVDSNDVSWTLSQEDLARCLKGEKALINYSLRQQQFVIEAKPSPICTQGPACASNLASEAQSWLGTGIAPSDTNCLSEDTWIEDFGCCSSCERYFKRLHNYSRETAWNNLARVFDLEMAWPPGA